MSIITPRAEYTECQPVWSMIDDCMTGPTAIKSKGVDYLPMLNPTDQSPANIARYDAYLLRAVFYGVTSRTANGMQSLAFARPPVTELGNVEYLLNDVDGSGVPLHQQCKRVTTGVIAKGRHGLLVDFPKSVGAITRRDVEAGKRATIQQYNTTNVINWRTALVGNVRKLVLVVLAEEYDAGDSLFNVVVKTQHRVLMLDENGLYTQQIYRGAVPYGDLLEPRLGNGQRLNFIPFIFVGSENNDDTVDPAPMEDIATLNIGHYRNSADYEESVHILQPTLFVYTDMDAATFKELNPQGIQIGTRTAVVLGKDDKSEILQIQPTTAAKEAMQMKEDQMQAIGARLISSTPMNKTVIQARADNASETSVLADIAGNVSAAYTNALQWVAMFMNENPDELFYKLSDDFGIDELTVEERAQMVAEWQSGLISKQVVRSRLREGGVLTEDDTDEKLDDEIAGEMGDDLDLDNDGE